MMPNVNELKRNAKNIIKKYSDAQVKVREATSNDPWGPSSTIMAEIADMTYNVVAFSEIMQMIWKRLNDHGKYWRHVFKALVLLEYLIKTGSDKVAQQCIENIFAIQALKDFQYFEPCENYLAKDHGHSVRDKSKKLVALLKDPERLKAERERALKAKSRLVEAVSSSGKGSFGSGSMMGSSRSSNGSGNADMANSSGSSMMNHNNNNNSFPSFADGDGGNNGHGSDIDSARPQSLTEEETQLQIALALSKEEAERQEATRKNDELRLKLALDVSKQAGASVSNSSNHFLDDFPSVSSSTSNPQHQHLHQQAQHQASSSKLNKQSNIDDLLGLSFTSDPSPTTASYIQQSQLNTLPQEPFSVTSSSSTIPTTKQESHNDPWGSIDPWGSATVSTSALPIQVSSMNSSSQAIPNILNSGNNTKTTTTAFPTNQPVKPTSATPKQFPLSDMDSIFGSLGVDFGGGINQNAVINKKVISKNPFED